MILLAFDTTSERGGVGIYRDGQRLASVPNDGPANRYSVTLFQMVERALEEAKLALGDIELIAVANGPGSFTGIRVGIAAAQGWARAFDRPVKGVSVLEAMVEAARTEGPWAVPVLDARRGEFYLGFFGRPPGRDFFQSEREALVLRPAALGAVLEGFSSEHASAKVTCITRDHDERSQALRAGLPSLGWQKVSGTLVDAIARLALRACREGRLESPGELAALYIRRPDAELVSEGIRTRAGDRPT